MISRILACAALVAAASSAAAETGGSFRDWTATCTTGLTCSAAVFESGDGLLSFGLRRGAATDAPLELVLGVDAETRLSGDVVVRVDGETVLTLPATSFKAGAGADVASSDERVRSVLLQRLREGRRAEVSVRTGDRDVSRTFSLSGTVAALRKIDDDQKRVGTATALIDRGDKPLPDRAALPTDIAGADDLPGPVRTLWRTVGECDDPDNDFPYSAFGFSVPFGTDTRLYVVACGTPGAYNYPSRLFSYTEGLKTADTVPLPDMSEAGPTADMTIWNAFLDGDRLTSFFKGRGIGDCGQLSEWRIDAGASALSLVEARAKDDCDGEGADDPDGWPRIWPPR